jgi:hypothetical protein
VDLLQICWGCGQVVGVINVGAVVPPLQLACLAAIHMSLQRRQELANEVQEIQALEAVHRMPKRAQSEDGGGRLLQG